MKKFLLVVMIGMVLAMNLCGVVKLFINESIEEVDHIKESTIAVYVE